MLTKNIVQMREEMDAHIAADKLIQGSYWDEDSGKGCFIGCLVHDNDPRLIEDRFNVSISLTRVLEDIFESLPKKDAVEFAGQVAPAIGVDGKDLSKVVWKFLASELRALPAVPEHIQKVIDPVIEGMELLADGKEWDAARAADAAYADALDTAAYAAARAADAADARAARLNVRKRQAETILQLLREAPVLEGKPEIKTAWLNIYDESALSVLYPSREDADKAFGSGERKACIQITWTEGEGL